jgi:error-prone DNA polymerase
MLNNYPLGFYTPATLIKDAQRHGLRFRYVDVNHSDYLFRIEKGASGELCVRVGLKYVKGLRQEVGEAIVAERRGCADISKDAKGQERRYSSVEDLVRRVPIINKKEIRALSLAGALNFEKRVHRREALWQSELAMQPAGELFSKEPVTSQELRGDQKSDDEIRETAFIKKMNRWQLMETDLVSTGITIGKHPMAFIRDELSQKGVLSAADTYHLREKDIVTVAGAVIVRQRPSTSKDVVFITMEDETGHSNFIVMPDVFERFRQVITHSNYLLIKGIVEEANMIKGLYFQPINAFIADVRSHDFH